MRFRREVIRICRLMLRKQLVSGTDGSVRVRPDAAGATITPGRRISGGRLAAREVHRLLADHESRLETEAVIYAHPPHVAAPALAGRFPPALPLSPKVILSHGDIPAMVFAPPASPESRGVVREPLTQTSALPITRHGSQTVGRTSAGAFDRLEKIDYAASGMERSVMPESRHRRRIRPDRGLRPARSWFFFPAAISRGKAISSADAASRRAPRGRRIKAPDSLLTKDTGLYKEKLSLDSVRGREFFASDTENKWESWIFRSTHKITGPFGGRILRG